MSGPVNPIIPTSFITDSGTVIPALNSMNVNGGSLTTNSANGITATANPNGSANMVINLTNRLAGNTTTAGAVTGNVITFGLGASVASYRFSFDVVGRDTATGDTVGYTVFGSAKTSGAAASIVATPFIDNDEDASLLAASINLIASGNNVILQVTGVAARTISFRAVGEYVVI